jgi:hypothetical protein
LLIRNADSAGEPRRISIISLSSSKLSVYPRGGNGRHYKESDALTKPFAWK